MKLFSTTLTTLLLTAATASAGLTGDWKLHPTFDNSLTQIIDTPERVYFTGLAQTVNPKVSYIATPESYLFYYDKEGDEVLPMSIREGLSSTAIDRIDYNSSKNYLTIVYNDADIDLLYDNGDIRNVAAIKNAQIPGSKGVNAIFYYPKENLIYLATDFGYVAIDDEKYEVKESRNYNTSFSGVGRLGDNLFLISEGVTYMAPAGDPRLNLSEYSKPELYDQAEYFLNMGDKDEYMAAVYLAKESKINVLAKNGNGVKVQRTVAPGNMMYWNRTKDGYLFVSNYTVVRVLGDDNSYSFIYRNIDDIRRPLSSWDMKEFWTGMERKGIRSERNDNNKTAADNWTITRDWMMPNAPNAYISRGMAYHPEYGMLVNSFGPGAFFPSVSIETRILLSGYKNGLWTPLSPAYRNPEYERVGYSPMSMVIDPDNPKYVYTGSMFCGVTRLNLDDPQDILMMSHPKNLSSALPGYVEMHPDWEGWSQLGQFHSLSFDSEGTLWACVFNWDEKKQELWYWPAADRRASVNAESFRPWKKVVLDGIVPSHYTRALALKAPVNRGLVVGGVNSHGHVQFIYDTNKTLDNRSDDKLTIIPALTDQDGGVVDIVDIGFIHEDEDTGTVWLGCKTGLYYFQPRALQAGQYVINRVKVSRNDGTSLADYLLNGITVTDMTVDASGRKWFATSGAGVVVTSADGRNVVEEFVPSNSYLPSDNVFQICYNPDNRSVMIGTDKGVAEYFISGSADGGGSVDNVRAYPNPVAPDYYGWVTIDGLPDNAHVKIVDAQGNLVKDLGRSESGAIQWDVLNLSGRRVNTGVYYILSSGVDGGSSNVGKILIMN